MLVLVSSPDSFRTLASTVDTSLGRVFDHVAKLLAIPANELGFGAALEAFCEPELTPEELDAAGWTPHMPNAMRGKLQFSYSGLHSAVERYVRESGSIDRVPVAARRKVAKEFQDAAFAHLGDKVVLGLEECRRENIPVKDVVVSGGVASNMYLRKRYVVKVGECSLTAYSVIDYEQHWNLSTDGIHQTLCSHPSNFAQVRLQPLAAFASNAVIADNAVMIAWAAMHRFALRDFDSFDVLVKPTWRLEEYTSKTLSRLQWVSRSPAVAFPLAIIC